jgi:hypothetical protein
VSDEIELLERAELTLRAAIAEADGRLLAARIEIDGVTAAHGLLVRERERLDCELRGLASDLGVEQVWVERIQWQTAAPSSQAIGEDAVGETLKVLDRASEDPQILQTLADGLRPLALKLPAEVKTGPDGIDPSDPETLARILEDVRRELPSMLIEGTPV